MKNRLMLGAVAYCPNVVTIWEGFKAWFAKKDLDFDMILYSNYEAQVEGQFAGHVDIAWNSPLAWVQADRVARQRGMCAEAVAMRDTDQDLTSVIVVREESDFCALEDLKGKTVGVGAEDSPQATLIPLNHLAAAGLQRDQDFKVLPFDRLVGKHGDHVGGERHAAKALIAGEVDAACMIDANHWFFGKEGTLPSGETRILTQTAAYDHCNFTVLDKGHPDLIERFRTLLLNMSYSDPKVRPLLDLEGLKAWKPGRTKGYGPLQEAIASFGTIETFTKKLATQCS